MSTGAPASTGESNAAAAEKTPPHALERPDADSLKLHANVSSNVEIGIEAKAPMSGALSDHEVILIGSTKPASPAALSSSSDSSKSNDDSLTADSNDHHYHSSSATSTSTPASEPLPGALDLLDLSLLAKRAKRRQMGLPDPPESDQSTHPVEGSLSAPSIHTHVKKEDIGATASQRRLLQTEMDRKFSLLKPLDSSDIASIQKQPLVERSRVPTPTSDSSFTLSPVSLRTSTSIDSPSHDSEVQWQLQTSILDWHLQSTKPELLLPRHGLVLDQGHRDFLGLPAVWKDVRATYQDSINDIYAALSKSLIDLDRSLTEKFYAAMGTHCRQDQGSKSLHPGSHRVNDDTHRGTAEWLPIYSGLDTISSDSDIISSDSDDAVDEEDGDLASLTFSFLEEDDDKANQISPMVASSLDRLAAISSKLRDYTLECDVLEKSLTKDPHKRQMKTLRFAEAIMKQVILESDSVPAYEDDQVRAKRKELVDQASILEDRLDKIKGKEL